jgi:hypothetical protein
MSTTPEPGITSPPAGLPRPDPGEPRGPLWIAAGPHGLRAGWAVLLAYGIFYFFRLITGTIFYSFGLIGEHNNATAASTLFLELIPFFAMIAAGFILAAVEQRRILDYNLAGQRPGRHLLSGAVAGFLALSALMFALRLGGWMRFGPATLSGAAILHFAALWGCAFLTVGCVEEGLFRCYLQFTLTRGINFWWALAAEIALCLYAFANSRGGAPGVYAFAAAGLLPCLALHQKAAPRSAFWQAAWVTSTFFGLIHTFNTGETWIGIFAAASIGFVFCVSVRVTGSAWWAIGCHAAWDWTETFFYGTADSGLPGQGHLLTTTPAGSPLLSGGTDGPEGSLLVLAAIALLLALLLAFHARRSQPAPHTAPQNA